jgi:hypothetical protein
MDTFNGRTFLERISTPALDPVSDDAFDLALHPNRIKRLVFTQPAGSQQSFNQSRLVHRDPEHPNTITQPLPVSTLNRRGWGAGEHKTLRDEPGARLPRPFE